MEIKNLQEFVNSIMECDPIELHLYSVSTHRIFAEKIINQIVRMNNDYESIAYCFCNYALQKWCIDKRVQIEIDLQSLNDSFNNKSTYFGLSSKKDMFYQKQSLALNDSTIEKIDEIIQSSYIYLNKSEIRAIEDIFLGTLSSKYIVCNYFESAIEKVFSLFYQEFNVIMEEKDKIYDGINDDILLTFHNADNLIYIASNNRNHTASDLNGIDFRETYETVRKVIDMLSNYPFKTNLKSIMFQYLSGQKSRNIANNMDRSQDYVDYRIEEGLKTIEALIWGMFCY